MAKKEEKKDEIKETDKKVKKIVKAEFIESCVLTENSDEARELFNQNNYGTITDDNKVQLHLLEAVHLLEKKRIEITEGKKNYTVESLVKKGLKTDPRFWTKYVVFRDMRNRGYTIKTALKFGADFRCYDRGVKPGEDHAKWLIFAVNESETLTWQDFSAKNRVANSTKKRLLIAVTDSENDITYYEIRWMRP